MLDVLAIGAANTDFFYHVKKIPGFDEEVAANALDKNFGGSAANFAIACSKLNLKTGFISCIGNDREGNDLLQEFERAGIDTKHVKRVNARTGRAVILLGEQGEKAMVAFPGSNDLLSEDMIPKEAIKGASLLHLTSLSSENAFRALLKAKQTALENNVLVSIDPGHILARKGFAKMRGLIDGIDFLFPSRSGLELITGKKSLKEGCRALRALVKTVVVTMGEEGCFLSSGKEQFRLAPPKAKVVDTTGAGDAFAAGFVYGVLKSKGLKQCAALANVAAALNVQGKGARASQVNEATLLRGFRKAGQP